MSTQARLRLSPAHAAPAPAARSENSQTQWAQVTKPGFCMHIGCFQYESYYVKCASYTPTNFHAVADIFQPPCIILIVLCSSEKCLPKSLLRPE